MIVERTELWHIRDTALTPHANALWSARSRRSSRSPWRSAPAAPPRRAALSLRPLPVHPEPRYRHPLPELPELPEHRAPRYHRLVPAARQTLQRPPPKL